MLSPQQLAAQVQGLPEQGLRLGVLGVRKSEKEKREKSEV
jgi:hypothetical protein